MGRLQGGFWVLQLGARRMYMSQRAAALVSKAHMVSWKRAGTRPGGNKHSLPAWRQLGQQVCKPLRSMQNSAHGRSCTAYYLSSWCSTRLHPDDAAPPAAALQVLATSRLETAINHLQPPQWHTAAHPIRSCTQYVLAPPAPAERRAGTWSCQCYAPPGKQRSWQ